MDELGKSPEVWANESVEAAHQAVAGGLRSVTDATKARFGSAGVDHVAGTATDGGMEQLVESLVTDALGKVLEQVVGEKKRSGKLKKKKGKIVFDRARFSHILPTLDTALTARGNQGPIPGSSTPAKDEYVRTAARTITKPESRDKLMKKAGIAMAQKGTESALKKSPEVLGEAAKHRPKLLTAATTAASDTFQQQIDLHITEFRRDLQTVKMLKAALKTDTNRRDLIANAERVRVRAGDRGSVAAFDAVEALGVTAAEQAIAQQLIEVAPKAGENLQRDLTKNLTKLDALTRAANAETDRLMKDPTFANQAAEEAINESLEGKMDSSLKFIATVCGKGKRPGDAKKINVIIRVPVDPSATGFLGFQVRTTSLRNNDLSLSLHAELNLIGGAKIPGIDLEAMGALGGYFDVKVAHDPTGQRNDAQQAGNLLSYGLYRRFRESSIIPKALADWIWGMGGKSMQTGETKGQAKTREAETWGKAMEEGFAEGDMVETGGLVGGRVKAGVQAGGGKVGIRGGLGVRSGKRYTKKSIEAGNEKKKGRTGSKELKTGMGKGVTTLYADAAATIGPLTAGADFSITFRDAPKDDEDHVLDANLSIYAQGMVMKKAMFGDPAEAGIRLATWLAEIGLLGRKVIDQADEQSRGLKRPKMGYKDFKLMKKGRRLGMEGFNTASALFAGEWTSQHQAFEQAQALQEGAPTISEVGDKTGELVGNVGSGVSGAGGAMPGVVNSVPNSISSMSPAPTQQALQNVVRPIQPALQNLGELKEMILDKTAGLKLSVNLGWPSDGEFTGDINLDYVKRTGAFILNNLKTTGLIDASFETSNRLFGLQFAPSTKVTWLYDDVDKQKLIATKDYLKRMGRHAHRFIL